MKFLHLSDVHFGYERRKGSDESAIAARNNYMRCLTDTICEINRQNKFDFILLTGDIAWAAASAEYDAAQKWLKELLDKCGLSSNMLLVCPGNHDIDRGEAEDIQYPADQCAANRFLRMERLDKLQRRFAQYAAFCENLGLEKYKIGSKSSYLLGCRDMGDFRVVCLNTAWYAKDDTVKDKMWIGAGFWEMIKEDLVKCGKPVIAIMHHPSSSWHEQERSSYAERTNIYSELCNFTDIILSGHTHEIKDSMEQKGTALIGASGALYEGNLYPNCFYTYDIDFSSPSLQTRTRYFWNAGKWVSDPESFQLANVHTTSSGIPAGDDRGKADAITPEEPTAEISSLQSNLFYIAGHSFNYISIIGSWNKGENEYFYGDFQIRARKQTYQLPKEILECFRQLPGPQDKIDENINEAKVRLNEFNVEITGGARPHRIIMDVSKATYRDFLIVKSVIDHQLPSGETVRSKYLGERNSLISRKLPNVCGVGIYVITSDNKILISKSSPYVIVNPNQYIYSASGSMNWADEKTNPFNDVIRECKEEIGYEPSIEKLRLYSIGIDYATGYYQFSFYERSDKTAQEIIRDAHMARDFHIEIQEIVPVDFRCDKVMAKITTSDQWDETAKANLLTLAVKNFGKTTVEKYLSPERVKNDFRRAVKQEWDSRAERHGRFPVLSSRYAAINLNKHSDAYIKAVLDFIDEDLSAKTVLELGGGIGLFTKYFAEHAKAVTCIDVCEKMIIKNKARLGYDLAQKVDYVNDFFQDYKTDNRFDLLVCSLVLIHNAPEIDEFVANMKRLTDTIYLFEHTDDGAQVSRYTEPKTKEEYIAMFPEYRLEKLSSHMLCQDKISFIKLQRAAPNQE